MSLECRTRKREYGILEIQRKQKVDRWQAGKIVDGQESIEEWSELSTYRQYVYMETDAGAKRRSCLFEVEKNLRHQFGVPREDILTERKGFVIKTTTAEQHSRLMKAERVGNIQCTISTDNSILRSYNSE